MDAEQRIGLGPVYVVGTLGFDFGTEARREAYKRQMGPGKNPYDVMEMVAFLEERPHEARALLWTLNLDLTPIYTLRPVDGLYEELVTLLARQAVAATDDPEDPGLLVQVVEGVSSFLLPSSEEENADLRQFTGVERIAVAGTKTGETERLYSGQVVPVLRAHDLVGWEVLARSLKIAQANERQESGKDLAPAKRRAVAASVNGFLSQLGVDRNLGDTSPDRALNYGITSLLSDGVPERLSRGEELRATVAVEKNTAESDRDLWNVALEVSGQTQTDLRAYQRLVDVAVNPPAIRS
ncbi:hypothetical protein OG331_51735 [Streptomyces sp. NBC_01017]|uniref:hypothetical protein n=1 Tax=Streptomyces sp. NBC_01017 TaxID=2903721 RepID=UPI00386CDF5A|nr:hypothetical protein OG331_00235 [Streptomyces sp. NBC_01017]WSV35366.1 hypothetical protein OG331_51735 [Streptomyces sp. NBC_01017]